MSRFWWRERGHSRKRSGSFAVSAVGSEIDGDTDIALIAVLKALPKRRMLSDPDSTYAFMIEALRIPGGQIWLINRFDREEIRNAMGDLDLGAEVSILDYTRFAYLWGRLAAFGKTVELKPADGLSFMIDPPKLKPIWHEARGWLRSPDQTRVSLSEVWQLTEQLRRVRPIS